jgi:hypothetical protein
LARQSAPIACRDGSRTAPTLRYQCCGISWLDVDNSVGVPRLRTAEEAEVRYLRATLLSKSKIGNRKSKIRVARFP